MDKRNEKVVVMESSYGVNLVEVHPIEVSWGRALARCPVRQVAAQSRDPHLILYYLQSAPNVNVRHLADLQVSIRLVAFYNPNSRS